MKKHHYIFIAVTLIAIMAVVNISLYSFPKETYGQSASNSVLWPSMYGQVGSYWAVNPGEISAMSKAGLTSVLFPSQYVAGSMLSTMQSSNVKLVDPFIWDEISSVFKTQIATGKTWTPTADQEQTVLSAVKEYLNANAQNQNIIGYWVLDDYPWADIRPLLDQINALIAESNKTSIFPRPSICGFGGVLDEKTDSAAPFVANINNFTLAATNFTPDGCDMVALYPYGVNLHNDPTLVDWSMSNLLPAEFQILQSKGWDQSREPLIGMPQTFGFQHAGSIASYYVLPTAQDVATQVQAYCQAGAVALLAYTWDDNYAAAPRTELFNSPDLVQGLQQGVNVCKSQYWTWNQSTSAPTPSGGSVSQDATPPIIMLNGANPLILNVGDTFSDPGVAATDNIDGNISGQVVSTSAVNTAAPGSYLVTYQVSDSSGNRASTNRTVIVNAPQTTSTITPPAQVAPAPTPTPVVPTSGFWSFIPFVKKSSPKTDTVVTPTLPTPRAVTTTARSGKKNYTITKVTDTLNGVVVHVSTTFPDNWQLDTSTMANGSYTMVSTLTYADGTSDSSSQMFTVDNTKSIFERIASFIKNLLRRW